jgi:hypothetical protein
MFWASFLGGLAGVAISIAVLAGAVLVWDYLAGRSPTTPESALGRISEKQLERYIVENFDTLFPNWEIFDDSSETTSRRSGGDQPTGVQYPIKDSTRTTRKIDILCLDPQGVFIVVELKKGKPKRKVVGQVDRYMKAVKQTLAEPDQQVKGLVIAKSFDSQLRRSLNGQGIRTWTYDWQLDFTKGHSD